MLKITAADQDRLAVETPLLAMGIFEDEELDGPIRRVDEALARAISRLKEAGEITGANMKRHLARHGINVEIKRIAAGSAEVQTAILAHAADSAADFIVIGGYGHSRLRELILGGVTRSILKSMPVPVLMSH